MNKHLLWCDLETTGVHDTRVPGGGHVSDWVIEVAVKLTDFDYETIWEYQSVVKPPVGELNACVGRIMTTRAVREMHTANGLVDELVSGKGDYIGNIEAHIVQKLGQVAGSGVKPILAGSGVSHFDIRFLKRDMPRLILCLGRGFHDVGVVRRFAEAASIALPRFENDDPAVQHRGMIDVEWHIREARWYRETLFEPYARDQMAQDLKEETDESP